MASAQFFQFLSTTEGATDSNEEQQLWPLPSHKVRKQFHILNYIQYQLEEEILSEGNIKIPKGHHQCCTLYYIVSNEKNQFKQTNKNFKGNHLKGNSFLLKEFNLNPTCNSTSNLIYNTKVNLNFCRNFSNIDITNIRRFFYILFQNQDKDSQSHTKGAIEIKICRRELKELHLSLERWTKINISSLILLKVKSFFDSLGRQEVLTEKESSQYPEPKHSQKKGARVQEENTFKNQLWSFKIFPEFFQRNFLRDKKQIKIVVDDVDIGFRNPFQSTLTLTLPILATVEKDYQHQQLCEETTEVEIFLLHLTEIYPYQEEYHQQNQSQPSQEKPFENFINHSNWFFDFCQHQLTNSIQSLKMTLSNATSDSTKAVIHFRKVAPQLLCLHQEPKSSAFHREAFVNQSIQIYSSGNSFNSILSFNTNARNKSTINRKLFETIAAAKSQLLRNFRLQKPLDLGNSFVLPSDIAAASPDYPSATHIPAKPFKETISRNIQRKSFATFNIDRKNIKSTFDYKEYNENKNDCTKELSSLESNQRSVPLRFLSKNDSKNSTLKSTLVSARESSSKTTPKSISTATPTPNSRTTSTLSESTETIGRTGKLISSGLLSSCFRKLGFENSFKCITDPPKIARAFLSLLLIFNMLPLYYAVTNNEASDLKIGMKSGFKTLPWKTSIQTFSDHASRPTKSSKCDQTFVSRIGGPQNGTFSAPILHNYKNHSRQCLYTFLAGPGQRVQVVFKSFNLRGSPPDGSAVGELPACVHEYLDIYSEVQTSEPAELINSPFGGRFCGTVPPRQRISMYRAIAISFFTNKNVTTPDLFEGTYKFINASEYEVGIPIAGSPCSYTITPSLSINKTGALISPTYPGAYPKDMSCTYQFLGESNQRVRLEFRDFDLFFGGPHCPFDYVKIYDGPDNSSALIGTYCGQQRNLVLYSSESSLFVHFYTLQRTANTQNRGFKGIYEFSESFVKLDFIRENDGIHIRGSECDQKILSKKESTGFVLSPNYPYPYIPKTVCRYFIYGMQDAQHLERVRLEFSAFNIPKVENKDKGETNCSDGYLKIYLKGQETSDAYDKFDYELCGNETQRVSSEGPRLAMVFSSGELQGRGFKGKYTFETEYKIPGTAAPDGTCSFTYVSSSKKRGEFNSPRYPSNYPSDTNCSYLFLAELNEQVTIVFDHFKIKADGNLNATAGALGRSNNCYEDWLEMYVVYRDNNDRLLGRYCGLTAPGPVESPRGAVGLRITLRTDQENVASGFKARYFFETAKSEIGDCGGNFSNDDSGIITSPNYPANYKAPGRGMASNACNWIMTARTGYKLSIHFEHFSIEGDPANRGCPAAVMRLWVNVDTDQPPLELCGEKPPVEQWHYISTGQTARISFTTSDKTVGAQGFRIVWTEIQDSGPPNPAIALGCDPTYHFQCSSGYCIADKLQCDGVKNCGPADDSDEMNCHTDPPEEDHGVLIIIVLIVVSFLTCLLCTLCHSRRKRKLRHQVRQLGLHRNAHYDSHTNATVAGLSSSRRHLQSGGASISGSLHGINSGTLILPPIPPPPPHICISDVSMQHGMMINSDESDELDIDEDHCHNDEIYINDVRFEDDSIEHLSHHLENV